MINSEALLITYVGWIGNSDESTVLHATKAVSIHAGSVSAFDIKYSTSYHKAVAGLYFKLPGGFKSRLGFRLMY